MPFDRIISDEETRLWRREQNLKMINLSGLISALVNFRNNLGTGAIWHTEVSSEQSIAGRQHRKHAVCMLCVSLTL